MGESEVSRAKDIAFQNQAGVVIEWRIHFGGDQDTLGTVGRDNPDLVQE
jgi:hypothetical protein